MFPDHLHELATTLLPEPLLRALDAQEPGSIANAYALLDTHRARLFALTPASATQVLLPNGENNFRTGASIRGTVLSIRIVGIVELLDKHALSGRAGSETVGYVLSQLFATIIGEIEQRGGIVLSFGGEILTAVFSVVQLGSEHAAFAVAAALAVQPLATAERTVAHSIQLRTTVQTGVFFVADIGDVSHGELLLTGRAANRIARDRDSTPIGTITISNDTAAQINGLVVRRLGYDLQIVDSLAKAPTSLPTTPQLYRQPSLASITTQLEQINKAQRYLPYQLPTRMIARETFGGEFRPVTVAVISFHIYRRLLEFLEMAATAEQDNTIVVQLLDSYYNATQSVIQQYGGRIGSLESTGTGDRLYAFFGAPLAHEDDPRRAVEACLELHARANDLHQSIADLMREWTAGRPNQNVLLRLSQPSGRERVGIATGTVFTGILGMPQRRTYTVIGEPVSYAATYMAAAEEDQLLISALTYRAIQPAYSADPLLPLVVGRSGKTVTAFRLPAQIATTPQNAAAALVGRDQELVQLRAIVDAALLSDTPARAAIVVLGEAGVGKTRLLDELWMPVRVEYSHVLLLRTTCQSYEQTAPYAPIRRIFRQLLQIRLDDDRETQAYVVHHLLEVLVPEWSRFSPILGALLGIPIAETNLTRALSPEQRRDRLDDLIVETLVATAQAQPTALTIEDVQWLDPSSAAVLRTFAERAKALPGLLAFTSRPAVDQPRPWDNITHTTTLRLEELDDDASITLLTALLDAPPPPEMSSLLARVQGVPLYLEELVRYLIDVRAIIRQPSGEWAVTRSAVESDVPPQIEQIIMSRLDQLSDDARHTAEIASTIGTQFVPELTSAALSQVNITAQLNELRQAGILAQQTSPLAFRHGITCDVIYNSISFARRHELHIQVAGAIEQLYGDTIAEHHATLGDHYERAELYDRAFEHFLAAAQLAQSRYANQEAIDLYTRALAASPWVRDDLAKPDLALARPLCEGFGDVLALTGNSSQAREYYSMLITLFEGDRADQVVHRARLLRKLASTYEAQGNFDSALQRLERAATVIASAPSDNTSNQEHAEILSDIGWVHFHRNDIDQSQLYLEQALNQLEEEEVTTQTARILNRLGGVAWQRGDLAKAQVFVEQSLAASEKSGDLVGQASALNNLGILAENNDEIDTAIHYALKSLQTYERVGNRRDISSAALNLGWAFFSQQSYEKAQIYFTQALTASTEVHDSFNQMRSSLNLSRVMLEIGDLTSSEYFSHQSLLIATQLQLPPQKLENITVMLEILLQKKDIDGVRTLYQQGLDLKVDSESEEYGNFQRLEAKIALAQGDKTRAIKLLGMNEALFTRLQNLPEANRTRKLLAEIEAQE